MKICTFATKSIQREHCDDLRKVTTSRQGAVVSGALSKREATIARYGAPPRPWRSARSGALMNPRTQALVQLGTKTKLYLGWRPILFFISFARGCRVAHDVNHREPAADTCQNTQRNTFIRETWSTVMLHATRSPQHQQRTREKGKVVRGRKKRPGEVRDVHGCCRGDATS